MKQEKTFGRMLKALREDNDMTQQALADILNVHKSTVGHYERGKIRPSHEIIVRISNIFNVTTDYLLGRVSYNARYNSLDQICFYIDNEEPITIGKMIDVINGLELNDQKSLYDILTKTENIPISYLQFLHTFLDGVKQNKRLSIHIEDGD